MRKSNQRPILTLSVIGSAVSAALLVACGGTGEELPTVQPLAERQDLAVKVVDGPIFNALVCLDMNNNAACDSDEPKGRTDAGGNVLISIAVEDASKFPVIAEVGTDAVDSDSGPVTTAYRMLAPADKPGLISPLTTMVHAQSLATGSNSADAAAAVQAQTGVADALADYSLASAPAPQLARSVASAIVTALQAQAGALTGAAGQSDAAGVMITAADLHLSGMAAVHRMLPAITEAASAALPADGSAPDATTRAGRDQQVQALVAVAGLSAANLGLAEAASRSTASSVAEAPEPGARLDQFRYGDTENWSFRVFMSSAAESTPADQGTTRFRELRQSRQGNTLLSWAGLNDPNRRDEQHWTGSRWIACNTSTQGISSPPDVAGRVTSNYCDNRQITVSRRSDMAIAGKTFQEVFEMIRVTPGQGVGFGDAPAGFSGVRDDSLGSRTWPEGASLRYQASTPLATAPSYDNRDSNRVMAYAAEITAGGDARNGTPACAGVTSANSASLLAAATTLESLVQRMGGTPCRFNRGTLTNADGSRVDSGDANDWWTNSTLSLGRVGSAPVGASPYAAYYTSNKLLRVAFGPGGRADFFSCRERASDGSTRNCMAAGSGSYAITPLGDARLMTLSGQPAGLGYARVFVERAGAVYYGYQNKLVAFESRRLNLTALNALFVATGIPALVP